MCLKNPKIHLCWLFLLVFVSCSSYDKLLKSTNFDAKYEAAMKYYEEGDFFKATQLFENLTMYYRGRDKAEKTALYYAKSLVGMKDYLSAGYQFEAFYKQFPYSEYTEEAMFQAAYCKYIESPAYELDQKLTKEALENFKAYTDRYPNSPRMDEAKRYINECKAKLERKEYEKAYGYYKTYSFLAAYTTLQEFLYDYPESAFREDAMFYFIKSGYDYADNSIEAKQRIRFEQVINDINKFIVYFDNSKHLEEVRKILDLSQKKLSKLTNNTL